ncbi:MAG: cation diffusion facilitator family transporter [Anaerolineae bacterium]
MDYVISQTSREQQSLLAVNLGLAANVILAAVKTAVGIVGHSPALLAEGINSTSDVAYYLIVSAFMRLAGKPADDEHPYGHHQLESIGALLIGAFVVTTGIAVFWNAINDVFDLLAGRDGFDGASPFALGVALATVFLKIALTWFTGRIGRATQNAAVQALASDHRNDVFSASAAALGIFLGRNGYLWVDPLAGALVALIILRTGLEILRDSSEDLMDTVPGKALASQVDDAVRAIPQVREIEEIQAHRFGPYLVVNITIGVDGSISVAEGDRVASRVEEALMERIDLVRRVHVHYHPARRHVPARRRQAPLPHKTSLQVTPDRAS